LQVSLCKDSKTVSQKQNTKKQKKEEEEEEKEKRKRKKKGRKEGKKERKGKKREGKGWGVSQSVECLPSVNKALGLISNTVGEKGAGNNNHKRNSNRNRSSRLQVEQVAKRNSSRVAHCQGISREVVTVGTGCDPSVIMELSDLRKIPQSCFPAQGPGLV
jgi:hypothetical protein